MSIRDEIDPQGIYRSDINVDEILRLERRVVEAVVADSKAERRRWNGSFRPSDMASRTRMRAAVDALLAARAKAPVLDSPHGPRQT